VHEPVGLLVVHGIGSQKRGESLASCARALQLACPAATLTTADGAPLPPSDIVVQGLDRAVLQTPEWTTRLYEVYWADILSGGRVRASFSKFLFEETTWFPWFNWRSGLLEAAGYPRWLVYARTFQLWLLGLAATVIYEIIPRRLHSRVLDQIVADVWNYTHSLRGTLAPESPIAGAADEILTAFRRTAARARADGCVELQVIAHSLGTVIAYHALTRGEPGATGRDPLPLTRFYTIGSPLEKFHFIWTSLFYPRLASPAVHVDGQVIVAGPDVEWTNYYSPLDLVSGRIKRFMDWGHVRNERLWGLGGLARAHVRYFVHPALIARLVAGLDGTPQPAAIPWTTRVLAVVLGLAESLALPVAALGALLAGAALFPLVGAMMGVFIAVVLYPFVWLAGSLLGADVGLWTTVKWTAIVSAAWMLPAVLLFATRDGYRRARTIHRRAWQAERPPE
jgi:hypothetical protein